MFNLHGKYYGLGLLCRKPWNLFTELISVFRNRDAANIWIDNLIITEFRIKLTVSVGYCLFDLDSIKPWINISPTDQTKFLQGQLCCVGMHAGA